VTQTTTELLETIREDGTEDQSLALHYFGELDTKISSGESLPDQWRGESDRDVVEAWWMAEEGRKVSLRHKRDGAVTLPCVTISHVWQISFVTVQFAANTVDEAYALAAKWCKENQ
jgi:hypothetical protein